MSEISWASQPYPPEGASAADGIRKQLGSPELDLLTILVRESAQNSWDARLPDERRPVDYAIDLRTVGAAHTQQWRDHLLHGAPRREHLPLRDVLQQGSPIRVMTISDRGTTGLGGPTRADDALGDDHDFVSFVRNIGEPRDTKLGGGTYGFGKGIFYLVSQPGTILLYTRCAVDGGYQSRLMGCALWQSYTAGERRYTGRHWWGDISGSVVEPLVGGAADDMAHRLGLEPFGPTETGTTIVVIDPGLGELTPPDAADYLAETIAWHLWPKMLETSAGLPAMRFSVTCDGIEHSVPDPRTTRPLKLFVGAYEKMIGPDAKRLECRNPKQYLGRFGVVARTSPPPESTPASRMVGIDGLVHHVCLMRAAELVVRYLPRQKPSSEFQSYAGVFRADEALDEVYAKAEPPTHDAWNAESLDSPEDRFVRTTFRRIDEELTDLLDLSGGGRSDVANVALGAASTFFSPLLGGASGTGAATDFGRPGGTEQVPTGGATAGGSGRGGASGGSRGGAGPERGHGGSSPTGTGTSGGGSTGDGSGHARPHVEYVGNPRYAERDGTSVLIQEFRLPVPVRQRVVADLSVVLAGTGARETEPPIGAAMPHLLGWARGNGDLIEPSPIVTSGGDGLTWQAVVRPAPDTMTEIEIRTEAVQE